MDKTLIFVASAEGYQFASANAIIPGNVVSEKMIPIEIFYSPTSKNARIKYFFRIKVNQKMKLHFNVENVFFPSIFRSSFSGFSPEST